MMALIDGGDLFDDWLEGLGEQVLLGIQKLDVGKGFIAGVGIVLLAIIIDRLTQSIGKSLISLLIIKKARSKR